MTELRLVPPASPPAAEKVRQRVNKLPKPAAMLQCRCGGRDFIEVRSGVLMRDGKPSGGTKHLLCAYCLVKGERVVVV